MAHGPRTVSLGKVQSSVETCLAAPRSDQIRIWLPAELKSERNNAGPPLFHPCQSHRISAHVTPSRRAMVTCWTGLWESSEAGSSRQARVGVSERRDRNERLVRDDHELQQTHVRLVDHALVVAPLLPYSEARWARRSLRVTPHHCRMLWPVRIRHKRGSIHGTPAPSSDSVDLHLLTMLKSFALITLLGKSPSTCLRMAFDIADPQPSAPPRNPHQGSRRQPCSPNWAASHLASRKPPQPLPLRRQPCPASLSRPPAQSSARKLISGDVLEVTRTHASATCAA